MRTRTRLVLCAGPASECLDPDDRIDSILALDTHDGHIKWAAGARQFDSFNTGRFTGPPPNNCPTNLGDDWDFAQGAQLFPVSTPGGGVRLLVGAGQKSGEYWAVDALTGQIVWSAAVAPGSGTTTWAARPTPRSCTRSLREPDPGKRRARAAGPARRGGGRTGGAHRTMSTHR